MHWLMLEPFHKLYGSNYTDVSFFEAGKENERKIGGNFMRTCQWDK